MTLAEFRAQRDRHVTEEAKRAWVLEVSDPDSLPEGMMRFTVYECSEPGLGVIIDRYLDLELIYNQNSDSLYDAEDIAVHRTDPLAEFDTWEEALHKDPVLPRMAALLRSEWVI
jgi:membrane-bound lytic murein transglycosylase MltF